MEARLSADEMRERAGSARALGSAKAAVHIADHAKRAEIEERRTAVALTGGHILHFHLAPASAWHAGVLLEPDDVAIVESHAYRCRGIAESCVPERHDRIKDDIGIQLRFEKRRHRDCAA